MAGVATAAAAAEAAASAEAAAGDAAAAAAAQEGARAYRAIPHMQRLYMRAEVRGPPVELACRASEIRDSLAAQAPKRQHSLL